MNLRRGIGSKSILVPRDWYSAQNSRVGEAWRNPPQETKEGFAPNFGARPLKRTIQREVENPLSRRILLGEFKEGDRVKVDLSPEGLVFSKDTE